MDNESAMRNFNTRLPDEDFARLEALRTRLQDRYGPRVKVSYRIVIEEAMDALEKRLNEMDRKR